MTTVANMLDTFHATPEEKSVQELFTSIVDRSIMRIEPEHVQEYTQLGFSMINEGGVTERAVGQLAYNFATPATGFRVQVLVRDTAQAIEMRGTISTLSKDTDITPNVQVSIIPTGVKAPKVQPNEMVFDLRGKLFEFRFAQPIKVSSHGML